MRLGAICSIFVILPPPLQIIGETFLAAELDQRYYQYYREKEHAQRAGIAVLHIDEGVIVYVIRQDLRGDARTALGSNVHDYLFNRNRL